MPFLSTSKSRAERYDVVIIGSGAAGGMAAYALTKAGVKVLMLEAGRNYDPVTETPMFQTPADAPLRGVSTPEKPLGFFDATIGGWNVPGEPYVVRDSVANGFIEATAQNRMKTTQNFMWWRARMLGGRTNHYGRVHLRFGPRDFKSRSTDGLGFDWPIGYDDIAPWYDKVDEFTGLYGSVENLPNDPDSPHFQPAPKPRVYEELLRRGGKKLGIRVIASRMAILTKPLPGRAACFYATPCGRGCSIKANFQSSTVLIPPAIETGNLDVVTDAMAREITVDAQGRANGVHFIDKKTGKEEHVKARVVILGASALESARILLNSKSAKFPQGIGSSTGHLGRWLTDSTGSNLGGQIPALENLPLYNEDGTSSMHTYAPFSEAQAASAKAMGSPRGYYMAWSGGRQMPGMGTVTAAKVGDLYGTRLKEEARRYYGTFVDLHARGETIPNEKCYLELDPDKKDKWGIPVPRFHFEWSDYEVQQVAHMQKTFADLITAAGGKPNPPAANPRTAMTAGGSVNHEIGVTRMSAKPADGVTDPFGKVWDCPNVLVADGGTFVSNPYKNPTLTILALAWRQAEHVIGLMKSGSLPAPA